MIRKAKSQDIDRILELHKYFIKHHIKCNPKRHFFSPKEMAYFKEKLTGFMKGGNSLALVYEENGKILAYAVGKIKEYPPFVKFKRYGYISEAAVDPKCQKGGIGNKLVKAFEKFFRSKNIKIVELLVDLHNKAALSAWKKAKYKDEMIILTRKI
ncbi:GNAT family N-acetyltransferase [Nanoarchaeota archaeon]